jgi:hypothetical protein
VGGGSVDSCGIGNCNASANKTKADIIFSVEQVKDKKRTMNFSSPVF